MAIFMHGDDDQQRDDEGADGIKQPAKRRDQSDDIQSLRLYFYLPDCFAGPSPRHLVSLGDVIKGDRGMNMTVFR